MRTCQQPHRVLDLCCCDMQSTTPEQVASSLHSLLGDRGLGRQASLMWFDILGFWMVGFTSGWALTFKAGLGLSGIWIGILSGVTTTGLPSALVPLPCVSMLVCCQYLETIQQWDHHTDKPFCIIFCGLMPGCALSMLRHYSSGLGVGSAHGYCTHEPLCSELMPVCFESAQALL